MKRIVLGSTILASLAVAAGVSALLPQPSTASTDAKAKPQSETVAELEKPAEPPPPKPAAGPAIAEGGRAPVPLMRAPKREAAESPVTAETAPLPAPPAETRGWDNQLGAVDDGRRWADAPPRGPDAVWMQPGLPPPPPPGFVQRGWGPPRYFVIPLDGQRVMVVTRDVGWGGKKERGRHRGRDRD